MQVIKMNSENVKGKPNFIQRRDELQLKKIKTQKMR